MGIANKQKTDLQFNVLPMTFVKLYIYKKKEKR